MLRPKRTPLDGAADEFKDPLSNYDQPEFADDLERILATGTIAELRSTPLTTVPATTTIRQAMTRMVELGIACLPIVDDDQRLVGILSDRDILNKVAERYDELADQPVTDVMTSDPVSVYMADSPAKAIHAMAVHGFRHVPVLDADDRICGILGPRRVTRFLKSHASPA